MRKDEYINEVISKIENKKARREVEKELSAHIDDRISYYTDAGYDTETANEKAMEHMGRSEDIAEKMKKLHRNRISKQLIILCIIGMVKFLLAIIFYDAYEKGSGIMCMLAVAFGIFEMLGDGTTLYFGQPIAVLVLSIIVCKKRKNDETLLPVDYILAFICTIIWVIAAIACNRMVLLGL